MKILLWLVVSTDVEVYLRVTVLGRLRTTVLGPSVSTHNSPHFQVASTHQRQHHLGKGVSLEALSES